MDGLKGFPQAIETVYPKTTVQLCIVHMTRASLNYVSWKERKEVATDLKAIYRAATGEQAERQLTAFEAKWNHKYPSIGALWRRNWQGIVPFFQFSPEIRKIRLYHQRHREPEHEPAQSHQDPRPVPV